MRLTNARAIVTGASGGIGRAIAIEFAARGARVVLAARSTGAIAELADDLGRRGASAIAIPTDVTDGPAVDALVQQTVERLGGIDILVNNAGVGLHDGIAEASAGDVEALFRLNVLAAAACIRAVVPVMQRERAGMVINISSIAGRIAIPRIGYYSASKFALTAIGDALRLEEADHGIKVMNVFPGTTRSGFGENRLGQRGRAPHQRMPAVSAEKVARRIAKAVERDESSVYISWVPDRLAVASNQVAGWAVRAVLRRWARGARH